MALIDYHVHTPLCNHAEGCMEAFIKKAIKKGLCEICFLDHLTLRPEGAALSMSPMEVPLYYGAVRKLKTRYKGQICVKAGLEIDFSPDDKNKDMKKARQIAGSFAFDVIAGSVHFLDQWNMVSGRKRDICPFADTDSMYESYLDHLEAMVEASFFDIICHIDIVGKFGDSPDKNFSSKWNRIIKKIQTQGLVVELNTSGYRHRAGQTYPALALLKLLYKAGVKITMGSDAHLPDEVGQDFDRAAALAKKAGFTHLTTFIRRQKSSIAIDT